MPHHASLHANWHEPVPYVSLKVMPPPWMQPRPCHSAAGRANNTSAGTTSEITNRSPPGLWYIQLLASQNQIGDACQRRIQEEGLRTHLSAFAPHYKTLSLALLVRTFSLDDRSVNSIVSRMIWAEELPASLGQSVGFIIFPHIEPAPPRQLAQILAEKVGAMVEQNEKALDICLGGAASWGDCVDRLKGDKCGEQA